MKKVILILLLAAPYPKAYTKKDIQKTSKQHKN
jgi:hypothetical protein